MKTNDKLEKIKSEYISVFEKLKQNLDDNWLDELQ